MLRRPTARARRGTGTALATLVLAVLALAPDVRAASEPTLFFNGRIYLNDEKRTVVQALLTDGVKVAGVGQLSELEARAVGARRVDLGGATAVPGLQDAHGRLASFGESLETLDLRGAKSFAEVIERVGVESTKRKEGTWIVGRGWDQNRWSDASLPHHFLLSARVPKHPVFLECVDGHAALVNKAALSAAKLDGVLGTDHEIAGGRIVLDEEKRATGVLLDGAMSRVQSLIPPASTEVQVRRLLRAQERLLAAGLTAVHDMGTLPETLTLLRGLRSAGQLKLRVVAYVWANGEFTEESVKALPLAPDPLDVLCAPGIKLMADGSLGSRGAALYEDYSDAPGERGYLLLTEAELGERLAIAAKHGLQPAVHAIGDRANGLMLDLYDKTSTSFPEFKDLRPRIEHAQVVAPKDWPRFPELGVLASMQPVHAASDVAWVPLRLGPQRTEGANAWRALAPELGLLAFGSDFPVEDPGPLRGLHAARTRPDAEPNSKGGSVPTQRLDGAAALAGFTSGAAYACHQEDRRGRLLAGYFADLTVTDLDPVAGDAQALLKARVTMTVITGEIVYKAGGS
ncbi:MAG: amidohydrolase [Planctomycetota bacterium]